MTLLAILACTGDDKTSEPSCPGGWDWDGGACVARLPEGDGAGLGDPARLQPGELDAETQQGLAERFKPAMVFAGERLWPVEVGYCYEAGAPLVQCDPADTDYEACVTVVEGADLPTADLSTLDPSYVYGVDCPGDNSGGGWDEATWFDEWDRIQGDDPAAATWTPVVYAHLSWHDQAASLVQIQYWFWYPYNKFANNHEGDWEHINAIVDLSAEPTLVDLHWAAHAVEFPQYTYATRITADDGGDHPVVFVGGCGEISDYGGCYSGGSYPWPGLYEGAALAITEDVTPMARLVHSDEIAVVVMPEPDESLSQDLSWLPLDIYHGQWTVEENSGIIQAGGGDGPPTQPAYKGSWNAPYDPDNLWTGLEDSSLVWFDPPADWEVLYNPGAPGASGTP